MFLQQKTDHNIFNKNHITHLHHNYAENIVCLLLIASYLCQPHDQIIQFILFTTFNIQYTSADLHKKTKAVSKIIIETGGVALYNISLFYMDTYLAQKLFSYIWKVL